MTLNSMNELIVRLKADTTSTSTEKLITALKALNEMSADDVPVTIEKGRRYIQLNDPPDWLDEIVGLADESLILDNGKPNWPEHTKVINAGFRVYKGDGDSFGWLTGCISTKRGILVYG